MPRLCLVIEPEVTACRHCRITHRKKRHAVKSLQCSILTATMVTVVPFWVQGHPE